jgi:hypothetical protein
MTPDDRAQAGLPRYFSLHHYRLIDSFYKDRPNVHPPHVRDSSDPLNNNNYVPNQSIENDINMDDDFQDPINLHSPANLVAGTTAFTGDDPEDTDFADPPPRPVAAEASQRGTDYVTPEDLFKQSVSRRGLRSGNTGQRKRQDLEKRKLLEVTESNGISLVAAINRTVAIQKEVSEMQTKTQVSVCQDQISYMQQRDANSLQVQRNMVAAITSIARGLYNLGTVTTEREASPG